MNNNSVCWCIKKSVLLAMARCGLGKLVGQVESCNKSEKNEEILLLRNCDKDVRRHLRSKNVFDAQIDSEEVLILARAGNVLLLFAFHSEHIVRCRYGLRIWFKIMRNVWSLLY